MRFWKRTALASALLSLAAVTGCNRDDGATPAASTTPNPSPAPAAQTAPSTRPAQTTWTSSSSLAEETFVDVVGPYKPDRTTAKVIQTLSIFNHPSSCALSLNKKFLFVSNSAATVNGMMYGKGFISKLEVLPDGRLNLVKLIFVDRLHAPMGMDVLPKPTAMFPAGSLFVSTGMSSGCDERTDRITDIKRFNIGVSIFNPDTGQMIGFIPMAPDRAVSRAVNHPVIAPAGLCFDPDGNLFVADSGNTGRDLDPEIYGQPGILRLLHKDLDKLSQNKFDANVMFLFVRHVPGGVFYSKLDDAIYWTTCDGASGAGGAVYRVPRGNFPQVNMVEPVLGDLGPLRGVTILPSGTLICSRQDGDLAFTSKGATDNVPFTQNATFAAPGEIKLLTLPNGYNIVYVPEQEPYALEHGKQRLRVVVLPSGF